MIPMPVIEVWDATGETRLGVLGDLASLQVSDVLCDVGTMRLTGPRDQLALLDTDDDRQLCLHQPGAPATWWVLDDDAGTWISDDPATEPLQVSCRSLHALLAETLVVPSGGIGTAPATWEVEDATPGAVVAGLWAAAQARGMLQGLSLVGDADADADGEPWPETVSATYQAGGTLASVLSGLHDSGIVEWLWQGRELRLYRPDGGADRTLEIQLRPGVHVTKAPLTRSRRGTATAVVVAGADGATARRTQALAGRRAREAFINEGQAPSSTLAQIGDLYLGAHAASDVQTTHELADLDGVPVPWTDYRPGDRVVTAAAGPDAVTRRIMQVAVNMAPSATTVFLELGAILRMAEEDMQRQIARLLPGAGGVTG